MKVEKVPRPYLLFMTTPLPPSAQVNATVLGLLKHDAEFPRESCKSIMSRSVGCREWAGEAECSIPSLGTAVAHTVEASICLPSARNTDRKKTQGRCGHCGSGTSGSCSQSRGRCSQLSSPGKTPIPSGLLGYYALPTPCMSSH